MKKIVVIEDVRGGITTGYTVDDIEMGQKATITAQDENGATFEAAGKVMDFYEV